MIPVAFYKEGYTTPTGFTIKMFFLGSDGTEMSYVNEYGKTVKFVDYSRKMRRHSHLDVQFGRNIAELEEFRTIRQEWFK